MLLGSSAFSCDLLLTSATATWPALSSDQKPQASLAAFPAHASGSALTRPSLFRMSPEPFVFLFLPPSLPPFVFLKFYLFKSSLHPRWGLNSRPRGQGQESRVLAPRTQPASHPTRTVSESARLQSRGLLSDDSSWRPQGLWTRTPDPSSRTCSLPGLPPGACKPEHVPCWSSEVSAPHLRSKAAVGTQPGARGPSPSPPASLPSLTSPQEPPTAAAGPALSDQLEFGQRAAIARGLWAFL